MLAMDLNFFWSHGWGKCGKQNTEHVGVPASHPGTGEVGSSYCLGWLLRALLWE